MGKQLVEHLRLFGHSPPPCRLNAGQILQGSRPAARSRQDRAPLQIQHREWANVNVGEKRPWAAIRRVARGLMLHLRVKFSAEQHDHRGDPQPDHEANAGPSGVASTLCGLVGAAPESLTRRDDGRSGRRVARLGLNPGRVLPHEKTPAHMPGFFT